MSLKSIKNKIRSIDKTQTVTKAMEAVSAVKMRKSQERALAGRTYARSALHILERVGGSLDGLQHPLAKKRDEKNVCFIVITSDKGLAGNLNYGVLREVQRLIAEKNLAKEHVGVFSVGKKASEYFLKRGYNIIEKYENVSDNVSSGDMYDMTNRISQLFINGTYDKCYIVYTNFKSTFEQEPITRRILPLSVGALTDTVAGIDPERGKYATQAHRDIHTNEYSIEPNPEEVLAEVIPFLLNIEVYHALLEAKASEHSSRMVAMKNASDKAKEMSEELSLQFNKQRQALITREVSEIVGGIESMKV